MGNDVPSTARTCFLEVLGFALLVLLPSYIYPAIINLDSDVGYVSNTPTIMRYFCIVALAYLLNRSLLKRILLVCGVTAAIAGGVYLTYWLHRPFGHLDLDYFEHLRPQFVAHMSISLLPLCLLKIAFGWRFEIGESRSAPSSIFESIVLTAIFAIGISAWLSIWSDGNDPEAPGFLIVDLVSGLTIGAGFAMSIYAMLRSVALSRRSVFILASALLVMAIFNVIGHAIVYALFFFNAHNWNGIDWEVCFKTSLGQVAVSLLFSLLVSAFLRGIGFRLVTRRDASASLSMQRPDPTLATIAV